MKVLLKISALVVLLAASTYNANAQFDTVKSQPILDYPVYYPDPVTYPVYKPKPQPGYYPFFSNGVTGISEVVNRIAGTRYVSLRDYHGAKQFSYAEMLTEHLSVLNKKYEWGFVSVNIDTVVYILNHSREVYEPFGKGDYTTFYFDRNGVPMPRNIGSGNEPDKLIVFNNVAFVHCPTGGLMEPALLTNSYPARQKIQRPEPDQETEFNWFPDWVKQFLMILICLAIAAIIFWLLWQMFSGGLSHRRSLIFILMPPTPPVIPPAPIHIRLVVIYRGHTHTDSDPKTDSADEKSTPPSTEDKSAEQK